MAAFSYIFALVDVLSTAPYLLTILRPQKTFVAQTTTLDHNNNPSVISALSKLRSYESQLQTLENHNEQRFGLLKRFLLFLNSSVISASKDSKSKIRDMFDTIPEDVCTQMIYEAS